MLVGDDTKFEAVSFEIGTRHLVPLEMASPKAISEFQTHNRERFAPYAPYRTDFYYTIEHWKRAIDISRRARKKGEALRWVLLEEDRVLAQVGLDGIVYGAFQSALLSYAIDRQLEGQGVMTRCVESVVEYAFDVLRLHRLNAHHVPENAKSAALLKRLNFTQEGLAKSYLKLNGEWRDHVLNARINDRHL